MKIKAYLVCMVLMPMMTSCFSMNGDYEEITLESWEEGQIFKLKPPEKVARMPNASRGDHIILKIDGDFSAEDRIFAYHDEGCSNSINSVHAVHRDHVVLSVPSQIGKKEEIYLVNMRGDHSTDCMKLKID